MSQHRHVAAPAGAPKGRRRWGRYTFQASLGLGLVGLLAGLMFSTSAQLAAESGQRQPENLPDLVRVETEKLTETNAEVVALRQEVAALLEDQRDPAAVDDNLGIAAGSVAVDGPGLVVHQQDLEAVMNGLWAGGAEAMTVQGHRVTATTSVRCVGNVLLIDGATYSPPYEIAAIGDVDELEATLLSTQPVQIYLQYVEALNLGWDVRTNDNLEMAGDDSNLSMEYASVPG
ncbi:DUF881 domain-containing protein [Pseudactinotalea sp.]|uniref:DUF881 domain-containing protein n=1 Tax=Pseudactinotalea sp. TaxID=1926260 RepID=UPI003B3AE32B